MRLRDRHCLPLPLARSWTLVNDLDVLRQALPGCESLLEIASDEFVADMAVPLGLAMSRFTVHVRRDAVDAPRRCTLHFETRTAGGGGSGSATLALTPDGDAAATLDVDLDITIAGVMAQVGAPLIEAAARGMAALFLRRLSEAAAARRTAAPIP